MVHRVSFRDRRAASIENDDLRVTVWGGRTHRRGPADYLEPGACFDWPLAPRKGGGTADLRLYTSLLASSAYTAHLVDRAQAHAYFVSHSPTHQLAFGYIWRTTDFPWLGIWEENCSRSAKPWNGSSVTLGMEFGVSPIPESRREMIDRGTLFGVPSYLVPGPCHGLDWVLHHRPSWRVDSDCPELAVGAL